ncbi:MAG: HAMP domain-containing sensor histidine kinase, partial [Dehalococcoidia bacterium]|nr:HAMP domain-containing sensor histidine kinase [Dehalococcoidia bacterium]
KVNDSEVRVEVADTGVGISPRDLPHVFDEFYRGEAAEAPESREMEAKGVGLGLSICRKIVEAHRGRIWVESPHPDTGRGSLFVFTLPWTGNGMAREPRRRRGKGKVSVDG